MLTLVPVSLNLTASPVPTPIRLLQPRAAALQLHRLNSKVLLLLLLLLRRLHRCRLRGRLWPSALMSLLTPTHRSPVQGEWLLPLLLLWLLLP